MDVAPPYFIPVPFKLGTFGAFIQMRSPPSNRRALFDVAVAGPLAGLVIVIPALLLGLRFSSVTAGSDGTVSHGLLHGATVGSSILLTVLTKLSLGDAAQYGALVQFSPLALAGWLGLFVLPVGQLDGGLYNARNVRKSRPTSIAGVDLTDRKEVHGFVMWR